MTEFTQIATRCAMPQGAAAQAGATAGRMVQQTGKFRICKSVTQLQFKWANVRSNAGGPSILDAGSTPYTIKASVRYGGIIYPIMFPAGRVGTVQPDDVIVSLPLGIAITAGTDIELRWLIIFETAPASWPFGTRYADGWNQFGNALTDETDTQNTYYYQSLSVFVLPPVQILGNSGIKKAVEIVGDSISSDGSADAYQINSGYTQRGLVAAGIPFVNNGAPSNSLTTMLETAYGSTPVQKLRRRIAHTGRAISHVFCGICSADFASGRTDAHLLAMLNTYKAELATDGIKLVPFTCLPRTNSANTAKAVPDSNNVWTYRRNFNDALRANNGVGAGYMDVALIAQNPGNIDLWRNDLGSPTADGIHPNAVIHDALTAYLTSRAAIITGIWTP
jgi:hypothetical protein